MMCRLRDELSSLCPNPWLPSRACNTMYPRVGRKRASAQREACILVAPVAVLMDDLSSHEQNVYITSGDGPASIEPYRTGRRVAISCHWVGLACLVSCGDETDCAQALNAARHYVGGPCDDVTNMRRGWKTWR